MVKKAKITISMRKLKKKKNKVIPMVLYIAYLIILTLFYYTLLSKT